MPKVPFSLQPVLAYKENLVDVLERQLAQLLAERTRLQATLSALEAQRADIHTLLQREQRGTLHLERIQRHRLYLAWLRERIESERRQLVALDARIVAKRDELVAVMQDKEMLERLKEKAAERFFRRLEAQEDDFADEIALARHVRVTLHAPQAEAPVVPSVT
ncbi:MAG TPA: flagellar export protein FliJ [Chloroflexi bacterium]|jgi:flagellar FliJ protein|nr:flagellar export protein FliJ [Chloroflexota bacterium]